MTNNKMNGSEIIIKALLNEGVDTVFGYPGGAVLPIYDAIFQQNSLKHVLVRQEGGAVHMAEGYARSTGKVGVVLVTSGPGATNAVTGLTDALMDSIPIVCLTGQVPTHLIGNDAFQEADTTGITRPCTKHNYLVKEKLVNHLIDIGGEIIANGNNAGKSWKIGIQNPFSISDNASIIVDNKFKFLAIASSGEYRNYKSDKYGNKLETKYERNRGSIHALLGSIWNGNWHINRRCCFSSCLGGL